jgi:hypothetical protein
MCGNFNCITPVNTIQHQSVSTLQHGLRETGSGCLWHLQLQVPTGNKDTIPAAVEREKWTSSCNITGDGVLPQPAVLILLLDSNHISQNAQCTQTTDLHTRCTYTFETPTIWSRDTAHHLTVTYIVTVSSMVSHNPAFLLALVQKLLRFYAGNGNTRELHPKNHTTTHRYKYNLLCLQYYIKYGVCKKCFLYRDSSTHSACFLANYCCHVSSTLLLASLSICFLPLLFTIRRPANVRQPSTSSGTISKQ